MSEREALIAKLAASPDVWVTPSVAARVLGMTSAYGLNLAARDGRLGIPYIFSGRNLKISKAYLLDFCGWRPTHGRDD